MARHYRCSNGAILSGAFLVIMCIQAMVLTFTFAATRPTSPSSRPIAAANIATAENPKPDVVLVGAEDRGKIEAVVQREKHRVQFALQMPEMPMRIAPDESKVVRMTDVFFDSFSKKKSAAFTPDRTASEREAWRHFYALVSGMSSPPQLFRTKTNTRGIVMSCGGKYWQLCIANIRVLVDLHRVTIPIEVWYDRGELTEAQIAELDLIKATYGKPTRRTFEEVVPPYSLWLGSVTSGPTNIGIKQFHMKLMALVGSSFSEVLYLDADNTAARNPEYLFDTPEFRSTGSLFWPDMWGLPEDNRIWELMGVKYKPMWAMESGQLLLDKTRVWRELLLAAFLNQRQDVYYSLVNGDKDTFLMSWLATGHPFHMVRHPPFPAGTGSRDSFCGNSFIQSDPSGVPIFVHAVGAKERQWYAKTDKKWLLAKPFDPEGASPIYRWQGACIDVQERTAGAAKVIPFTSVLGNIEDALHHYARIK